MADNVPITPGSGATVSTEEVTTLNGGAVSAQHIQRFIHALRTADGVAADVTAAAPLPVQIITAPQVAVNNVETLTDNAAFTDGTSKVFPNGYIFDESAGTALTENDIAAARVNANRSVVTVTEDGVTRGRYATVKAASTAAVAADPAQVVTLSPNSPVPAPTLTKGTQGATGFSTQDLKDAGRNLTTYRMFAYATTATDALISLTGYKSGAAVTATTTPAVVTTGKTLRVQLVDVGYFASSAAIGSADWKLRANTGGVVAIGSPVVYESWIGTTVATAGVLIRESIPFPDGLEFAAGTGIGVSVQGINAAGSGAIAGWFNIQIVGYEY